MTRRTFGTLTLALGLALLLAQTIVVPVQTSAQASAARGVHMAARPSAGASPATRANIAAHYGELPLAFELNAGQADPSVRFLAHGGGYTLALTSSAALLALRAPAPFAAPSGSRLPSGPAAPLASPTLVGMHWLGANPDPTITGEQPLPGVVNYFLGNDPAQWHTNIPTYQQVRLHEVYPGVDLVYYGNQGQLEYDFVVAPGADPSRIALGFTGARGLGVDLTGGLTLQLADGTLEQGKPLIYQMVNGARQAVAGGFALSGAGRVGFTLGAYNPHLPLVIDPAYHFSSYLGGSGVDQAKGIAVDSQGSAYVVGNTSSTNFPTHNAEQGSNGGGTEDAFVTKLNSLGNALIYSTYLGGSGDDVANAVAVDSDGSAVLTGDTSSTNFPTANAFQGSNAGGGGDAFVTKLNPSGSALTWSTYLGGASGFDTGLSIALDVDHYVYIGGQTQSTNFPTNGTYTAFQGSSGGGGQDGFATEFYPDGHALYYSTYLGGSGIDQVNGIAVDTNFDAYVTGVTSSTDFPVKNALYGSNAGSNDAFVTELNPFGMSLVWSTYLGGSDADYGNAIALDSFGEVYVAGNTLSTNFPTTSAAFQKVAPGGGDAFVTELASDGSSLYYSTYLGGTGYDQADGITVDSGLHAIVTGSTASTNFPTVKPLQYTNHGGNILGTDAFVTVFGQSGIGPYYSSYLGGSGDDVGLAVARNGADDIYVAGYTASSNFPVTSGAFQTSSGGGFDGFVSKMQIVPPVATTTGVFRPSNGTLYLKYANTTGPANVTLAYGQAGDLPVTGDWIGQGYKTIGVYRNATFYLRNTNTTGNADEVIPFGQAGDLPVAGDWTGKGYDSIGVYRPSNNTFYLRNSNTPGPADITATFGVSGDLPIVGDWTNKGFDSIGIFRPSNGNVYLRNSNSTGNADNVFFYGVAGDKPVVGDWDGNGTTTIGVDRNGNFLLRNSNTTGPADLSFYLGIAGDTPIAGPWLGFPIFVAPPHGKAPATPSSKPAKHP